MRVLLCSALLLAAACGGDPSTDPIRGWVGTYAGSTTMTATCGGVVTPSNTTQGSITVTETGVYDLLMDWGGCQQKYTMKTDTDAVLSEVVSCSDSELSLSCNQGSATSWTTGMHNQLTCMATMSGQTCSLLLSGYYAKQ